MNPIVVYKRISYVISRKPVRPMMRHIKSIFNDSHIAGAEIGVNKGLHAFNILNNFKNLKKLYLIDPYAEYIDGDGMKKSFKLAEREAKRRLSCFDGNKYSFIKETSADASTYFEDNTLDFVYIDGNHAYEYVIKDIKVWRPKVKEGGVIGGDDFCIKFPGVCRAVTEYSLESNLDIKGKGLDWWFDLPKTTITGKEVG